MALTSHLAMSIGFFVGIIPSVILMFWTLRAYDKFYNDNHLLFQLAMGLIAGTITGLFYYWSVDYLGQALALTSFMAIVILFAIYELILITIILSRKHYDNIYELTFQGVIMGGAMAGPVVMFATFVYLYFLDLSFNAVLSIAFLVPTIPMLYITIGALIGYGLYKNEFNKYGIRVIILKSGFNVIFILWFILFLYDPIDRGWQIIAIGFVFAVLLYRYTILKIIPMTLPGNVYKKWSREKRREQRRKKRKG